MLYSSPLSISLKLKRNLNPKTNQFTRKKTQSSFTKRSYALSHSKNLELSHVQKENRYVTCQWGDGATYRFHYTWLKDNCDGNKDVAGQKRVSFDEIEAVGFEAERVDVEGGKLVVVWKDGKRSEYSSEWLLRYNYDKKKEDRLGTTSLKLWKADDLVDNGGIPTLQYDDVINNDEAVLSWCENLYKWGICLIKNVPKNGDGLPDTLHRINIIQPTMYGETFWVRDEQNPVNIAYTNIKLDIHQDLCYYEAPPALQMLHCIEFKATGGDSILADGFKMAEDFRKQYPTEFSLLATEKMTFEKIGNDHHTRNRRSLFVLKDDMLVDLNYSQPFEGPLDIDFDKVDEYYDAYRKFSQFAKRPSYIYRFKLEEGDLISFNNSRVFHGRDSYSNNPRTLQGAYMNYTDFLSRYRSLAKKYNKILPEESVNFPHYRVE